MQKSRFNCKVEAALFLTIITKYRDNFTTKINLNEKQEDRGKKEIPTVASGNIQV
ncbi:hypothetical protein [Chitinophaga sp. LS1]|uniref:hypothetical protein n=1 Tax=Chitinophaga sp. LS1 TaxID=3051176 RepID=UPI002AAAD594|nr:hypothetical protein [Chitinophaga sp. LS1]WPV65980.1 hypothetical protein QQL36_29710 [Chitinophaga sp. LS1]